MPHQIETNTNTLQSVLEQINALPEEIDITTPLAELNAVNGGTAATIIGEAVNNTEAHAISQEVLIAQIAEALEGKAGGGGNGSGSGCSEVCNVTFTNFNNTIADFSDPYPDGTYITVTGTVIQNDGSISTLYAELIENNRVYKFQKNSFLFLLEAAYSYFPTELVEITSNPECEALDFHGVSAGNAVAVILTADEMTINYIEP